MRIGFMLPAIFALGNPANGVAVQARAQAAALARRGHEMIYIDPWRHQPESDLDVLHFFQGGMALQGIQNHRALLSRGVLAMSPIIDSNHSHTAYRVVNRIGSIFPRLYTIPAILAQQAVGSDLVVCRSEHERERVIRGLGVEHDKAVVVRNGIDIPATDATTVAAVKAKYQLPEKFALHVSAYTQARKNVLRLVEATTALRVPLVLAGHTEDGHIQRLLAEKARSESNLRLLGYVDRGTRDALYHLCHVFCLPSEHEGTGLAALEAGGAGAHVVITRNGGTRDYFGDCAEFVSPTDASNIQAAIAKLWDKPRNGELAKHIRGALSWDACATALEAAYKRALEHRSVAVAA